MLVGSANDSVWDFGAGDWTMEAWVRPTLNKQTIIGKWDTTGTTDNSIHLYFGLAQYLGVVLATQTQPLIE